MKNFTAIKKAGMLAVILVLSLFFSPFSTAVRGKSYDSINNDSGKYFSGNMENVVTFVSFAEGETTIKNTTSDNIGNFSIENSGEEIPSFSKDFYDDIFYMYEEAPSSVKNYLKYQSRDKLNLSTKLLFDEENFVRVSHTESYYKPKYQWKTNAYIEIKGNEEGYDNRYFDKDGNAVAPDTKDAKLSIDGIFREQMLVREVVKTLDVPKNYNGDGDENGSVDSFVIITDVKDSLSWGTTCWAHMGVVYNLGDSALSRYYMHPEMMEEYKKMQDVFIGDAKIIPYNFIPVKNIVETSSTTYNPQIKVEEGSKRKIYNIGLLCHELMHTIGLYDYYSYQDSSKESVGEFDIMANVYAPMPNMLGYMRYKLGWLNYDDLLYINDSGTYTIYPQINGKEKSVCKIVLNNFFETGEYFMIEARSKSLATREIPFDGGMSGGIMGTGDVVDNGLIVYRINERASYINSNGTLGTIGYGNMFGDDEIYVFRAGNEKYLTSAMGRGPLSYALLGNSEGKPRMLYTNDYMYDMTTFGNDDKTKTNDNLISSSTMPSETIISYTDGKNSGIVISDVITNPLDGSITFNVKLPEKQGTMPVIKSSDVAIEPYFADGKNRIYWRTDVKSGTAHILAVRSTNRLKKLAERGATNITIKDFKEEKFGNYKTLYSCKVPLAEKWASLPEFNDEALIFIALESENGNRAVRYAGCIENPDADFGQFIWAALDPLYVAIGVISMVIVVVIVITIITASAKKRHIKMKK